jgi:putative membrane protein
MRGFLLRVLINAIVLAVLSAGWLSGITVVGQNRWVVLIGVALIFGLVNGLVKPLVNLMTCALTILTFGLFRLIVSGAMLLLTAELSRLVERSLGGRLIVDGLGWAILGAIVASIVGMFLERVFDVEGDNERERRREKW